MQQEWPVDKHQETEMANLKNKMQSPVAWFKLSLTVKVTTTFHFCLKMPPWSMPDKNTTAKGDLVLDHPESEITLKQVFFLFVFFW